MTINRRRFAVCSALTFGAAVYARADEPAKPPHSSSRSPFRIVGYLPDYRLADYELTRARGVTDLVVFSAEPTAKGEIDLSRLKNAPWEKLREFKTRERIRMILCIGGWERSDHFAAVVGSNSSRQRFVDEAVKLCLAQRLDGIDLDWEHPKDATEQSRYANLLIALKKAFAPHGLQLSVTMAAWQRLTPEAFAAVDTVQVMAYDHDDRHATFDDARSDIEKLLATGVAPEKLVLGLPFYGRNRTDRQKALTYGEFVAKGKLPPEDDEWNGFYFNGPATIERKTKFALASHLAGVMVWELAQDAPPGQSLLERIRQTAQSEPE